MCVSQRMNVATSLNSKYMRYAYVMLTSFFINNSKNTENHVYLLYSDLTAEDKGKLDNLVKSYSGILHWLLIDKEAFSDFQTTENWSLEAYYRLNLVDILPEDVDRLLYLDVDIIVNKPLREFYFTDMGKNIICACKDMCEAPFDDYRDVIFKEQIQNHFTYFCSGVLLMDIKEMRQSYSFEDYINLSRQLEHKMVAPDQDLLNYMHWKETKYVDAGKYNLFAWNAYINNTHYEDAKESASIIHFSGLKPWEGKYMHYDIQQLWWDYAKETPFYHEFLEECVYEAVRDPFLYRQSCSYREEIRLLSEELAKITKLYAEMFDIVKKQRKNSELVEKEGINKKKISFIICVNNGLYYDECVWYINHLHVPAGYEIDIICITKAESMAEGYNAAMKDSDAKYKIYLHQDMFIYNRYFIDEMLNIFQMDDKIGLMGVMGGVHLPQNAIVWNAWNIGRTYGCNYAAAFPVNGYQEEGSKWLEVEAIDGMLMATQYDIEWREDLKLGWDFYDISQGMEFRRQGYKIVVPYQREPWCMHDCGNSKLVHYDENRRKILAEYKDFFTGVFQPEYEPEYFIYQKKIFETLKMCLQYRRFDEAIEIGSEIRDRRGWNGNIQYALNMLDIYILEEKREIETESFFSGDCTWDALRDKYDEIKFIIRHAENGTNEEIVKALILKIKKKEISWQAVWVICEHSAVNAKTAIEKLLLQLEELRE